MEYFKYCLKHYVDFNGRARRMEYWCFALFQMIAVILACVLGFALDYLFGTPGIVTTVLVVLVSLGLVLPGFAVLLRRLHDIGKSGWWVFISLVPCVGSIILLVFLFLDSQPGTNAYGPNPKGV